MRLLNAKEVAAILQVSPARIYELAKQGILPSVRIGARQIRSEETGLIQWIEHGGRFDKASLEERVHSKANLLGTGVANPIGGRSQSDGGKRQRRESKIPSASR